MSAEDNRYMLMIQNCQQTDSGEYKAVLRNEFGEVTCKTELVVWIDSPAPPVFVESLRDMTIYEGENACFKCQVTGNPPPDVKWFKNGVQLNQNSNIKVGATKLIHNLFFFYFFLLLFIRNFL